MFIDMDGTINEYTLYSDATILKQMSDNYSSTEPILSVIETLEEISKIPNISLYILSLSKSVKITEEKYKWFSKICKFYQEKIGLYLQKKPEDIIVKIEIL